MVSVYVTRILLEKMTNYTMKIISDFMVLMVINEWTVVTNSLTIN